MIIIWAPSNSPQTSTYGSDLSPEDLQYEKEHWKPRTTFRYGTLLVVSAFVYTQMQMHYNASL
jgi:chromatin assembly factor 1 subunit B